ncbi:hypothetical protein [Clostridium lacusfryxellense]|uniref:hypothetical protein n=1 Tax=Clostridium lacusfryxellense TaxID=205328 RepID=UPI001C0C42C5|nr:hypothetical protein [Clostridium lacusfryxellense]MBU3112130.1 hypothetical protein [Clostridium lacusfryxellense]
MLTENQLLAVELLSLGEMKNEDIAKKCKTTPRNLYRWKLNEEFKASLQTRSLELKLALEVEGKCRMIAKGQMAIDNIINLANNSSSEKIKLDASIFIYESSFGKNINRNQDITEKETDSKISEDELNEEFTKFKVVSNE